MTLSLEIIKFNGVMLFPVSHEFGNLLIGKTE